MKYDVIVIGAGAAGLLAMQQLLTAGLRVCLLEASAVAGGRVATLTAPGFDIPVETGAEFVHGVLPLTLDLLRKAGIACVPLKGDMVSVENGKLKKDQSHDKHWTTFLEKLDQLKTDMSMAGFLDQHFHDNKFQQLRAAAQHYAEGFDLADIRYASAMAAGREWNSEEETQFRIPGGYQQLIDYLVEQCNVLNATIRYNTCATRIDHTRHAVTVHTSTEETFEASRLLITVSAGVLQSGALEFLPALDTHFTTAIQQLGFGDVIKILLQFNTAFWQNKYGNIGFVLSNESIPTWWTQLPVESKLLTGWLGGPSATAAAALPEQRLLEMALESLSAIFQIPVAGLSSSLDHYKIIRWQHAPYVKGGYSYVTTMSAAAKKKLQHAVEDTIFFAGEAVYQGKSQGTVEAALQSGLAAANRLKACGVVL